MSSDFYNKLLNNFPFITVCKYAEDEFVGIIQNSDMWITTFYDYGNIVEPELRAKFLDLGEQWWWESNRKIPINLFLRHEWQIFNPYLKTFNNKSLTVLHGPITTLAGISSKKTKRKSIVLVKRT